MAEQRPARPAPDEADGGFAFAAPKVLFGGRGRFTTPDYEPGKVNCLNILRLEYSKE